MWIRASHISVQPACALMRDLCVALDRLSGPGCTAVHCKRWDRELLILYFKLPFFISKKKRNEYTCLAGADIAIV